MNVGVIELRKTENISLMSTPHGRGQFTLYERGLGSISRQVHKGESRPLEEKEWLRMLRQEGKGKTE